MNVYIIRAGNRGAIKIGVAANITRRLAQLQTGNPFELIVMATIPCDSYLQAYDLEGRIHKIFKRQRIRGEWFQGNIEFKKIRGIIDIDQTSSKNESTDTYKEKRAEQRRGRKAKKKESAKKIRKENANAKAWRESNAAKISSDDNILLASPIL